MSAIKNKVIIYFAHPAAHKSRVNRTMINAVEGIEGITIRKLYDEYPDFHIDVKKEQGLLEQHDVIVWQHPFYWFSAPSLLKEWIDLVLLHGWAFGQEGNALKGKSVMTATSTGGGLEAYKIGGRNNYEIKQLLSPFIQTATICKMQNLPPFIAHGSLLMNKTDIEEIASDYKKIIISLRDRIFSDEDLAGVEYINALLE